MADQYRLLTATQFAALPPEFRVQYSSARWSRDGGNVILSLYAELTSEEIAQIDATGAIALGNELILHRTVWEAPGPS